MDQPARRTSRPVCTSSAYGMSVGPPCGSSAVRRYTAEVPQHTAASSRCLATWTVR